MTNNRFNFPFPTPKEIWGKIKIPHWSKRQNGVFEIFLLSIASAFPFLPQETTNRVQETIAGFIDAANQNTKTYEEILKIIREVPLLTPHDFSVIEKNSNLYGSQIAIHAQQNKEKLIH